MTLQILLEERKITKYHLSKISGVPKTTIIDICSGKSEIARCSARTIQQIARALDCTMEEIMMLDEPSRYNEKGFPKNKNYLERGLPQYLEISLRNMKNSWKLLDTGKRDLHWDIYWCELNADINCAEVEQEITFEQAWYLREKYLRMRRDKDD